MQLEESEDEIVLPKKVRLPTNLILSEGNKYLRLLKFHKAISSFEQILNHNFNNTKALLGRAKCYMRLGMYKEAWQDFQHITEINPKCTEAIYLKGVTEYLKGNFEKSFITYWESHKEIPTCDRLRQGYEMCRKAIENTLDVSLALNEEDIAKLSQICLPKDIKLKVKSTIDKSYDRNGLFSTDLKLLKDITNDKDSPIVSELGKDLFDYLKGRQKFWKMQNPKRKWNKAYYARTSKDKIHHLMKSNSLSCQLETCESALKDGQTETCIKEGTDLLEKLSIVSPDLLPEKWKIEAATLHFLGLAHLVEGDLAASYVNCKKQLSIARNHRMSAVEARALRDIGEIYFKSKKYGKAIVFFKQSLESVTSAKEEAVLLYKISDCNTHLDNLENARSIAQKCLDFAIQSQDPRFQFDVELLLAEISVNGKNMKAAKEYYRNALEIATQTHDPRQECVEYILQKLEESYGKELYSVERLKIVKLTNEAKQNIRN